MSTIDKELSKEEEDQLQTVINLYTSLDKLVRGCKLYEGKGALVERLAADTEKKMNLALEQGQITTKITPIGPMFLDRAVFDDGRIAKYLFKLYFDGVRELSFQPGITVDEIFSLAQVFNADYGAIEDDMVTLIWKADYDHIRYYAVDALGAQMDVEEESDLLDKSRSKLEASLDGEEMKMSSSDMRLLKSRDNLNWVRICKTPAEAPAQLNQLLDNIQTQLQQEQIYSRFIAIALKVTNEEQESPMVQQLFEALTINGNMKGVTEMLKCLLTLTKDGNKQSTLLLQNICSKENIQKLSTVFASNHDVLGPIFQALITVEHIDPEGYVSLLSSLDPGEARTALQEILMGSTIDMTSFYLDTLNDSNDSIVLDSISALGKIASERAIAALYKSLGNPLTSVRTAALKAINGVYIASERKALGKVLKDPDVENRMLALQILNSTQDRSIGPTLLGIMQGGEFFKRGDEEQELFFDMLSKYPSPSVFSFLNGILSERNLSRSKSVTDRQLSVVSTYKKMDSPDAQPMLQKALKNWFLAGDVKSAIKEALR